MRELLRKIASSEINNNEQLDELCDIVKKYYTDNKRHKYSEVSAYLMETKDIEYLLENLRKIQDRLNEHSEDENVSIKVFKLIDHISLELNRTNYNSKSFSDMQVNMLNMALSEASKQIHTAVDDIRQEQTRKIEFEVDEFKKGTGELKERVEDSYTQFVSILGIFSAIVLVFFGGMDGFGSIFSNMQNIGRFKLTFVVAMVGMIVFDIIFMFLYILAKLLRREIASSQAEIIGQCTIINWVKRVWMRYPYVLMFNLAMCIIMILSFVTWELVTYWGYRL